jgi:NADPH-dependent 2,4-dienoyl-CoA reductase/sulfur reductase-like enzyme/nitrite reductase/ring-hydroxylating ferredoxin subunit
MGKTQDTQSAPDATGGIAVADLPDGGMLAARVGEDAVLIARRGEQFFAVGANCSHYGGPLVEGLMVADTVRCPLHHACFSLRTGEALRAPALTPIACWAVERREGKIFVKSRKEMAPAHGEVSAPPSAPLPQRVVIVGGGAAGFAAAEKLRREHYRGSIVMLSDDQAPPVDRPNLSKDYLAGSAPEDWIPLRPDGFYADNAIDLRLNATVTAIDIRSHHVALADGSKIAYDRLLLATGAEAVRPSIPGADRPHVHTLRSLADCRRIIELAKTARRAVVLGASFIGLEVAAALRARNIDVHVVAPEPKPMERILGPQIGDFVRGLHEANGVVFHLQEVAIAIDGKLVKLRGGGALEADLVVAGIGVRPRIELAQDAGLKLDRGVVVDSYLETSAPGVFAAGDIARWPDAYSGDHIRVEHWVVAQRQGQTAALNMLGRPEKFTAVPFFWSQHYDVPINYVGHAESWDEVSVDGSIAARDCVLRYRRNGRALAVAAIHRDLDSLVAEREMEQATAA